MIIVWAAFVAVLALIIPAMQFHYKHRQYEWFIFEYVMLCVSYCTIVWVTLG